MKRIALLGATGSIGRQALEIVAAHPGLEICALASGSQSLAELAATHGVRHVQVGGDLTALLERTEPDVVLNAVVGFAGLPATLWALEHGVDLALANKESLVAAGDLALAAQERGGGRILPVDSEHSAVFQCLEGRPTETVHTLVLTASGGPFRGRSRDSLATVTPGEALAHPTWDMGLLVTTNSATLINKGLEVIEAHVLFDVPYDRIEVTVHPQSIVHSLVEFVDGSTVAQASPPNMRLPISLGLSWPQRVPGVGLPLDWTQRQRWTFEPLDETAFPAVRLAKRVGMAGSSFPAVFNAANEEAVRAFHRGAIGFLGILETVDAVVDAHTPEGPLTREGVGEAERWARATANALMEI